MTFIIGAAIIVVLVYVLARKQDAQEAEAKRAAQEAEAMQEAGDSQDAETVLQAMEVPEQAEVPQAMETAQARVPRITADFAVSQMTGGADFMRKYAEPMTRLQKNKDFVAYVNRLHVSLAGMEYLDSAAAKKRIAEAFEKEDICERFPEVMAITGAVSAEGRPVRDAYASVYYAMWAQEA